MKSFALVRADNSDKVKIALHDLERYGDIQFSASPRSIEANYADELLVSVMGVPLKSKCNSAALVELNNHAGLAISRLKKIHPPAHVVIISPKHKVFEELTGKFRLYPEFDRVLTPREPAEVPNTVQEPVEPGKQEESKEASAEATAEAAAEAAAEAPVQTE